MSVLSLKGRCVVVTGASSGLGEAYARALANADASLVLVARRRERLTQLGHELGCEVVVGDVGDPSTAVAAVDKAINQHGRLDVLVNNAGPLRDRTLLKMTDADFDEVLRGHSYGTFYMGRACAHAMRDQGAKGMIVNTGSGSGLLGAYGQTNYAAAKAAIAAMSRTWSMELARYGISVNCVLPNAYTDMTSGLDQLLAEYRYASSGEKYPRLMGEASECAPLVVLLASERWQHLTGLLLSLGGDRLSRWHAPIEQPSAFAQGGWSVEALEATIENILDI